MEIAVAHSAVRAMKEIKPRASFEVYLKKFLQSLNLILPNPAGHPYRGAARRFGYLLHMVKERYKDNSLDIADAGAKVKSLINEHLVDLGINPKIPPVELLSDEFISHVYTHSQGNDEAKASEMEHAIRKHCTVHFGDAPPKGDIPALKALMLRIVAVLQETIGVLDFWKKSVEVKRLRGAIDTEILLADIPALNAKHERLAVEIVKLAEKRHLELTT